MEEHKDLQTDRPIIIWIDLEMTGLNQEMTQGQP
jgi:oligoribonuclease (3'-5' exoribonuclease)